MSGMRVTEEGYLEINRNGEWLRSFCPFMSGETEESCHHGCRLWVEVKRRKDPTDASSKDFLKGLVCAASPRGYEYFIDQDERPREGEEG